MRTTGRLPALSGLAAAVAALAIPASAHATFPGRNGEIVYGWSGAGHYRGAPSPTSIRAVEPRTGAVRALRECPFTTEFPGHPDCRLSAPRYSPDGQRIALVTSGSGLQQPGLATMAADGADFREQATAHPYQRLAWSPAGDRMLLERPVPTADYMQRNAVFLASLDGSELSQVTPEWTGAPDWSSRGQIAYVRYRETCVRICSNIYVTRLGGTLRRFTGRGGSSPSWSPDGRKLAFVRNVANSPRAGIYLVRRDGRGLRRLVRRGDSPTWSPDGKWIAFIRTGDLYVIRVNGRGLRRVVDEAWFDGEGPQVDSIDWRALPRP
jgi:dipeptidyl aminopeptidase/acylaminoacyl peptidase